MKFTLVVISGGIVAVPAAALQLGDVKIHSTLGQPLRASIPYALGPNEALFDTCVTLPRAGGANGLPSISQPSLSITDGIIAITASSIVREPLVSMRLSVRCNYTPLITRDYLLFINPTGATPIEAPAPDRVAAQPRLEAPPVRRIPVSVEPMAEPSLEVVEPVATPVAAPVEPVAVTTAYEPGDVILVADNPYVEPVITEPVITLSDEPVAIADTQIEPNVPINVIQPAASSEPSASNWMLWLGGGGVAIALAMLLFGRSFRSRFGSTPIAPVVPQRNATDNATQEIEAIADDSPTSENLALDADLIIGTGLQEGTEVDVSQDFGFAATTELDLELPADEVSRAETLQTDILPPLSIDESSILKSEVLPEEDEYHMSMIVDATKTPLPEDATARDLAAVQLDIVDETLIAGDYSINQEVDFKVLEQDYEDEMTATQALNAEILKAAEEVAVTMDDPAEKPLATVHDLEVTAQMPVDDQVTIDDDDDTGINPTINMEV